MLKTGDWSGWKWYCLCSKGRSWQSNSGGLQASRSLLSHFQKSAAPLPRLLRDYPEAVKAAMPS